MEIQGIPGRGGRVDDAVSGAESSVKKGVVTVWSFLAGLAILAAFAFAAPVPAEDRDSRLANEINNGTIGLVSGGISGTYVRIASDMASVLDNGKELRILTMVGRGSIQNVSDILYLKGIDIGIVQSDVLEYLKREGTHRDIQDRLRYITKLYNEEFHLVAGEDVRTVKDLRGKKVNFGNRGSGTYMTSSITFAALGVPVEPTSHSQAIALEKVKSGEIAAMVYIAGKPARAFTDIKPTDGLRLVPVDYEGAMRETYLPSSFSETDYPGLVPPGKTVPTIAVGAVMAVFNWTEDNPRYQKVARFVDAFFNSFDRFQQPPRHGKWREVNLSAELPGWVRFGAAQNWLDRNKTYSAADLIESFKTFLAENQVLADGEGVPSDKREDLFKQFIQWQREQAR